jgi:hypothetical protein
LFRGGFVGAVRARRDRYRIHSERAVILAIRERGCFDNQMKPLRLRREIKKAVDLLPPERLESLADYVSFLTRPPLEKRLDSAEKAIASGKGLNWRKVRSDV